MKRSKEENRLIRKTISELNTIRKKDLKLTKEEEEKLENEEVRNKKIIILIIGVSLIILLVATNFSEIMTFILIGAFFFPLIFEYNNYQEKQKKKNKVQGNIYEKFILNNHHSTIDLVEKWLYAGFRLEKSFFIQDSFLSVPSYKGKNERGAIFNISKLVKSNSYENGGEQPFGLMVSLKSEDFSVRHVVIQSKFLKDVNEIPKNMSRINLKSRSTKFLAGFDVFSRDEEEGNRLLTSSFLQPLLDLLNGFEYSFIWTDRMIWSFKKNEISILILSKHPFWELPSSTETLIQRHHITRFTSDMEEALGLIDKLDLQLTKIPVDLKKEFLEKNTPEKEEKDIDDSPYDHLINNSSN
jgi:hypothetical protein